jgi:uncharacterized protein YndB with AHSA1/START domain
VARLRKTISIDATPDDVWSVLGDLRATVEWLPGTVSAQMEDAVRVCVMADGNTIREEICDYSSDARTYTYRHLEVPLPVRDSSGTFSVEPDAAGSVVVLEASFEALDPAMEDDLERMFGGALEQALDSLRRRVEQGVRWEAA